MEKIINGYTISLNDKQIDMLNHYQPHYYPTRNNVFRALALTSFVDTKVVILGQDPYPNIDDACGLAFSVNRNNKLPKSLVNIFKLLELETGEVRTNGDLSDWAKQGVLLLNSVLTYNATDPTSHLSIGWQDTTDSIIKQLSDRGQCIFVLLGKYAQSKTHLIDESNNTIICSVHPSPLSAYRGFFDSKLFTNINLALKKYNYSPINWNYKKEKNE